MNYLKYFITEIKILSLFTLVIFVVAISAQQDFTSVTDEQLFFFLKQWPECQVNEEAKEACNSKSSKVRSASPRTKRNFLTVINDYQEVAMKAGSDPDDAQEKTAKNLSDFLTKEFSIEVPKEIDANNYPELAKFIKKYGLPNIFTKKAEQNKEYFENYSYGTVSNLPNFFLKGSDINRIINAERARRCIEINNLDQLDVPRKYLGKIGDLWRVFAEKIKPLTESRVISLLEIQQLTTLAEETGFRDWNEDNWRYDKNNSKFTCIDTEDNSFAIGRIRGVEGMDLPFHCKANYVMSLLTFEEYMEPKAQEWLIHRIEELINSPEGIAEDKPLFANKKYDDPEIDFEKVKEEFEKLRSNAPE
jgi:hypothetical protein